MKLWTVLISFLNNKKICRESYTFRCDGPEVALKMAVFMVKAEYKIKKVDVKRVTINEFG